MVSLVRAILGMLLLLSALREAARLDQPSFGDVFHIPLVPEALVPSRRIYVALVALRVVLAALVIAGPAARASLLASAIAGIYLLFCDRLFYHNNRYALYLFSFLLAFAPCDRAFVWRRRRRGTEPTGREEGALWAQRLAQLQLSIIYLASGSSKLLDADWRQGLVIGDRLMRGAGLAVSKGVPPGLMDLLAHDVVASGLAKLAIFTELFLAVGLYLPRTRFFALWWGVMFHLTIEITSQVELFGWLSLAIYALFAVPKVRERVVVYDPERASGAFVGRILPWLDWLARFDVRRGQRIIPGAGFAVSERDGSWAAGLLGWARIARATPILFPLAVPLSLLARQAGRWRLSTQPT